MDFIGMCQDYWKSVGPSALNFRNLREIFLSFYHTFRSFHGVKRIPALPCTKEYPYRYGIRDMDRNRSHRHGFTRYFLFPRLNEYIQATLRVPNSNGSRRLKTHTLIKWKSLS